MTTPTDNRRRNARPRQRLATWRPNNVAVLLIVCAAVATVTAARYAHGRTPAIDGVGVDRAKVAAATERINPNTASVGSLRRLPGIGPLTAEAIVDYRRRHGPGAFVVTGDLRKVHGVGSATVQRIAPKLALPATP